MAGPGAAEWGDCFGTGGWDFLRRMREEAMKMHMSGHRTRTTRGFGRGFAPPWAAGWDARWGGPERPRQAKGNVRLAVLALLLEGPRHGYQLIGDIADRSHGAWSPSPGSVYPTLSALQDEGLIDDEKVEGKRVFSLTDDGRQYADEHADEIGAVFAAFSEEDQAELEDLRSLMMGVGAAAVQVIASGHDAEARRILVQTRRDLFAVLAADPEEA